MEHWKPIKGYEGLYEVSDLGNVRSLNYKRSGEIRELSKVRKSNGYLEVCLMDDGDRKVCNVHRLVAEAFLPGGSEELTVDHINSDKTDNRLENLRWIHRGENAKRWLKGKPSNFNGSRKVRLIHNNEEYLFRSQAAASRFLGRNSNYISLSFLNHHRLTSPDGKEYTLEEA